MFPCSLCFEARNENGSFFKANNVLVPKIIAGNSKENVKKGNMVRGDGYAHDLLSTLCVI